MPINQLRKDPISGRWTIVLKDDFKLEKLILNSKNIVKEPKSGICPFCETKENLTPQEIMALRKEGYPPNGDGWRVRVIPDKNPVLQIYGEINNRGIGLYDVLDGIGAHEIVIETPRHYEALADLDPDHITEVLWTYKERILDLKEDERLRYIMVHKNSGEAVGETAEHSYSFVIGSPITPKRVRDELVNSREYYQFKERCVFCDVIRQEKMTEERIIIDDGSYLAFAPFASRRPFEVWIAPQKHQTFFEQEAEIRGLAHVLKTVLSNMFKLLNKPDYTMVLHSGPNIKAGRKRGYWQTLEKDYHWHIEITPRLRSYTSFEVSAGFPVNSVAPYRAAELLRTVN